MRTLDWLVVFVYVVWIVYDGLRRSKGTDKVEGYFLANRSLPWWAVGLSVMATQMSAVTMVGTTGQAYATGLRFVQLYFGLPLAMIILSLTVVPFFHRAKVYTAYEYLERRFDVRVRSLASFTMRSIMMRVSSGLIPAVGSSSNSRRGRLASAIPISSARCSPCASVLAVRPRDSHNPTSASNSSACSVNSVSRARGRHIS